MFPTHYSNCSHSIPVLLHSRARSFQSRIEKVAQCIAEKIDAEYGDEDTETGKKRQPPRGADVNARVGEHGAPGGNFAAARRRPKSSDWLPR